MLQLVRAGAGAAMPYELSAVVLNSFEGDERNGWGKERILTTERHEQAQ